MIGFRNLTIRRKLTLLQMATSAAAVLVASTVFYLAVVSRYSQTYRDDLVSLARILGNNCQAALSFGIPEDADLVLASLRGRSSVVYASILDGEGNVFAAYNVKQPVSWAGAKPSGEELAKLLAVTQEISLSGQVIGTITLYDDMRDLRIVRRQAMSLLVMVVGLALGIAFLLSSRLRELISRPISALSAVSHQVSENRDYSIRVERQGSDELGRLADSFNDMLGQIEKRDSELRDSEKRFRTLIDQAVDAFFLCDTEGRIVDVNQNACGSLMYAYEELTSMTFQDLSTAAMSAGNRGTFWGDLSPGESLTVEGVQRRKDGTTFPVEVKMGMLELGDRSLVMALARDITERKHLQGQLLHSQKMEAIGRLTGGIAHDFNNILTAILGHSELALLRMKDNGPLRKDIEAINEAGLRAANLTRQLLAFSRKQVLEVRVINLDRTIENMVTMLKRVIGEEVELVHNSLMEDCNILADPGQMEQFLMNLAVNAKDAMPRGGQLIFETEAVELDDQYVRDHPGTTPGPHVMLTVADTGEGMTRETQKRVFEPFFTTKESGRGTGLGLATVYGIVRQHQGHIYLYSEPGRGTTFRVYFPKTGAPAEDILSRKSKGTMPRGTETVLVVDDEPAILQVILGTLRPLGYKILTASSGPEAIRVGRAEEGKIGLLLTDVVMPKMGGSELAAQFKILRPEMKVMYMSGYTDDVVLRQEALERGTPILNKPLMPHNLASRVREAMDQE